MKPSLQFRLSQHLTLTPQLQQSIRLLQLSTVELNQEIERILMENPALEREDGEEHASGEPRSAARARRTRSSRLPSTPASEAPAAPEPDWPSEAAANWRGPEDDEDGDRTHATPDTPTLRDHLRSQLTLTNLGARDRLFVELLIDALDEDGYLTQPLEEIAAMLPASRVPTTPARCWKNCRSRCATCSSSSPPASARARRPSACRCRSKNLPDDAGAQARAGDRRASTSSCSPRATTRA